jgi:hypothetical protein
MALSREDLDEIKGAVREAIEERLFTAGIDIKTDEGVKETRANWSFLTDLRNGTSTIRNTALVTVVTGIATALAAALWIGIKTFVNHPTTPTP